MAQIGSAAHTNSPPCIVSLFWGPFDHYVPTIDFQHVATLHLDGQEMAIVQIAVIRDSDDVARCFLR